MSASKARPRIQRQDPRSQGKRIPWAGLYLFVTAFVVPLVYSNATIDPVLLPRFLVLTLLGIIVVTSFGVRFAKSTTTLSLSRGESIFFGCFLLYVLTVAISASIAGLTPDGLFELLKRTMFVWLVYAGSRVLHGERRRLILLSKFVVLSALFVGGFAILQYYQVPLFEWMKKDTTVDSTMGSRNLLASFLPLAFPFVAYAFFEAGWVWRVASATALLISVFLVVALQTRAVWVAFPTSLVFGLFLFAVVTKRAGSLEKPSVKGRTRAIQCVGLMALGVALALLFHGPGSRAPMGEQVGSLVQFKHASIQERLQLWSRTLRMIGDHPLVGVGPGNWRIVIPEYGTVGLRSDTGTLHFQRPHDDFLWVASETGLIGGFLYLAVFGSLLVVAVSSMMRARSLHDRLALTLMLFGVSCYVVDSLFSFPMERMAHTVYLSLLIGTILSLQRAGSRNAARPISKPWATAIIVVFSATTLLAGRFAWSRFGAEVHLRRALEARASKNWPLMGDQLDRIDERYYVMDPTATPVAWYRGVARFEMGDREAALRDFRKALKVHPNHVHVLNNIATCYALGGDLENAVRTYEKAIAIAPRFEEAKVNLGFLLHHQGKDQEAYELLAPSAATATSPRFKECFGLVKAALGLEN